MNQKGQYLEEIVRQIQETLKDSSGTVIHKNYKIQNVSGVKREFDIFIENILDGKVIGIAIECKNHSRKISIQEIDAFQAKCSLVPEINRKIFISSNGFQKGAVKVADQFGIELQIAFQSETSKKENWIPIKSYHFQLVPGGSVNIELEDPSFTLSIHFPNMPNILYENKLCTLNEYMTRAYHEERHVIHNTANRIALIYGFLKPYFWFPVLHVFKPGDLFIIDDNKKHRVKQIVARLHLWFAESSIEIKESNRLETLHGEVKANTLSVQFDENISGNLIRTANDRLNIFMDQKAGLEHIRLIVTKQSANKVECLHKILRSV